VGTGYDNRDIMEGGWVINLDFPDLEICGQPLTAASRVRQFPDSKLKRLLTVLTPQMSSLTERNIEIHLRLQFNQSRIDLDAKPLSRQCCAFFHFDINFHWKWT